MKATDDVAKEFGCIMENRIERLHRSFIVYILV
jgi:hypothetical protein